MIQPNNQWFYRACSMWAEQSPAFVSRPARLLCVTGVDWLLAKRVSGYSACLSETPSAGIPRLLQLAPSWNLHRENRDDANPSLLPQSNRWGFLPLAPEPDLFTAQYDLLRTPKTPRQKRLFSRAAGGREAGLLDVAIACDLDPGDRGQVRP